MTPLVTFQSHAGSIEALALAAILSLMHLSFNPTLVRLRHPSVGEIFSKTPSFNPTLVRLRQPSQPQGHRGDQEFQSHAGSIEALVQWLAPVIAVSGFNPTLVRLRRARVSMTTMRASAVSIPRWFD